MGDLVVFAVIYESINIRGGIAMKWFRYSSLIFGVIFLVSGCNSKNKALESNICKKTSYCVIEKENKTYYKDFESITGLNLFKSVIEDTIRSFNEVKDGKRDLEYVDKIASDKLKNSKEYKKLSKTNLKNNELSIICSEITSYQFDGVEFNKDENIIKVYIYVENNQKQKESEYTLKVYDNQTYVYKLENESLTLLEYNLSEQTD